MLINNANKEQAFPISTEKDMLLQGQLMPQMWKDGK